MKDWTPSTMYLRQNVLKKLMTSFPNQTPKEIYDAADMWCDTHSNLDGVVEFFKQRYKSN
tara:strand:- start:542 stop:721 length:180 start_codon:yes stop_codon:yes gene_type:complete